MVLGAEIVVDYGGVGGDKGSELDDPGGHAIFDVQDCGDLYQALYLNT